VTTDVRSDRILAAVRAIPLFRGLSPKDQQRIAALASVREYRRGDALWHEGDPAEALTLIVRGRVKIVRRAEAGDVILELFGEGEPVGALAVYSAIPYPASAICLEPATILLLPRRDYFELLDRTPDFARALIRELTRLVVSMARKLEETRGQKVEARVAQLFVSLAERMGKPAKRGVEVPIKLSRQEVADLVGTTVETAIRVLSRWGREGVLITGEGRFTVPDLERLREIGGGRADPGARPSPAGSPPRRG
jgi:CRP/FNR family transcriptional regulator, nitrogen oxide reductase regulator